MTTIQISPKLQNKLNDRKIFSRETYEEIIWDLIEDTIELSEDTKKELEYSRKQIEKGEFSTLEEVEKRLKPLNV